ncbi:MAG TPA: ABC transporter ATP-binding protein [Bryobacteraceae bacterium]|jgi:lipopolysaccharide transport system ATP-binding protein|nr:ABC transporter ATP-binding protein [Bryobacteraceae bacterium]
MSDPAIILNGISKCYDRFITPADRMVHLLFPKWRNADKFWALQDINLEVPVGQTVGIIGRNGSGKSTLLQIVAGTMAPTCGQLSVNGRVSALLELGSGFNPEFTGRQNVFFNGRLLGLTFEEVQQRFDEIAGFADIGDFLEYPVKTYSSGMSVRLAFSVAISVNPKILIVDEALAVGDARFQQKCMARIKRLRDSGVSILFVSHDSDAIKRLCDYGVVLEKGRVVNRGNPVHMANWYLSLITANFDLEKQKEMEMAGLERDTDYGELEQDALSPDDASDFDDAEFDDEDAASAAVQFEIRDSENEFRYLRHGDGSARIVKVVFRNSHGQATDHVLLGETVSLDVVIEFLADVETHIVGFYLRDRLGTDIIGLNTYQEKLSVPQVKAGERFLYRFSFRLDVRAGVYGITTGVAYSQFETRYMDWIENVGVLRISDPDPARMVFGAYLPAVRKASFKRLGAVAEADSLQITR